MELTWHGLGWFVCKGENSVLEIDPLENLASEKPDVVILSHEYKKSPLGKIERGLTRVYDWPGEYEVKGVIVKSIPIYEDGKELHKILVWQVDGISFCHVGPLSSKITDEVLEQIGNVDILMVPVGGNDVLDGKRAHEVVEKIDPRIVVPMYHSDNGEEDGLEDAAKFLKEVGKANLEAEKKLKMVKSKLPQESTEFVLLAKI